MLDQAESVERVLSDIEHLITAARGRADSETMEFVLMHLRERRYAIVSESLSIDRTDAEKLYARLMKAEASSL